jgi:membrane protease YdiL (CAAX protease family)
MNGSSVDMILYSLLCTLLLSMLLGMILACGWALGRFWRGQPILPERPIVPMRRVPWGALTVFWVVILYGFVNVEVSRAYAVATGRHAPPAKQADQARPQPVDNARPDVDQPKAGDNHELTQTDLLLQLAVINGLLLILVPLLVRCTSGATLADLGLSLAGWRRQLALGVGAALVMTPIVIAVQIAAVRVWRPHKHPIEDMVLESFSPGIALLAVVSSVVLAPMIEELLFRAIVQRWLTRLASPRGSSTGIVKDQDFAEPELDGFAALADARSPSSVDATEIELKGTQSSLNSEPGSSLAIISTSLFFAALHAPQWPAPIAIFILSMALGTLYQRTGSLLASVAMHGTFNGYSTMVLLLTAVSRQVEPNHAAQQAGQVIGLFSYLITIL